MTNLNTRVQMLISANDRDDLSQKDFKSSQSQINPRFDSKSCLEDKKRCARNYYDRKTDQRTSLSASKGSAASQNDLLLRQ